MPQRVNVSTTCSTTTTMSAQISSEYVPPPNTRANVVSPSVFDVPGVATGCALEMISVKPSSASSIPSVVTNELMPTTAVKMPLISPTMHAPSMASTRLGTSGRPQLLTS